jgi:hypothetical protein
MKYNTVFIIAASFVISFAFVAGCKKTDKAPKTNCRITSLTSSTSTAYVTYNSEMKVSSFSSGKYKGTYSYSGNTVVINTTNSDTFFMKQIVTLNANGLASNYRIETNTTGTAWGEIGFEYNGNEVIKWIMTAYDRPGLTNSINLTWSSGNLIKVDFDSSIVTFTYFADRTVQAGDYLQMQKLFSTLEGLELFGYVDNKNLLKSMTITDRTSTYVENYDYGFDADGKIASITISNPHGVETTNYQYQCN